MVRVLAGRVCAVVAVRAVRSNIGVVEIRRCPGQRRVAVITVVAALQMRRMFAGRSNAVVTGVTAAENLRVVDGVGG